MSDYLAPSIELGRALAVELVNLHPGWTLDEFTFQVEKQSFGFAKRFLSRRTTTTLNFIFVPNFNALRRCLLLFKAGGCTDLKVPATSEDPHCGAYIFLARALFVTTNHNLSNSPKRALNMANEEQQCNVCYESLNDVRYDIQNQCTTTNCTGIICTCCYTKLADQAHAASLLKLKHHLEYKEPLEDSFIRFDCIACRQPYKPHVMTYAENEFRKLRRQRGH